MSIKTKIKYYEDTTIAEQFKTLHYTARYEALIELIKLYNLNKLKNADSVVLMKEITVDNKSEILKEVNFFYTPKSSDELTRLCNRLSGGERALATQFSMHGWNLACHLINK